MRRGETFAHTLSMRTTSRIRLLARVNTHALRVHSRVFRALRYSHGRNRAAGNGANLTTKTIGKWRNSLTRRTTSHARRLNAPRRNVKTSQLKQQGKPALNSLRDMLLMLVLINIKRNLQLTGSWRTLIREGCLYHICTVSHNSSLSEKLEIWKF